MLRFLLKKTVLFSFLSISLLSSAQAAITEWGFMKAGGGSQTQASVDPTVSAYFIECWVDTDSVGDATSVTLSGGNINGTLAFQQDGTDWYLDAEYATEAEMLAVFQDNSSYTITLSGGTLGSRQQQFNLGDPQFPNLPTLQGESYNDATYLDVGNNVTLTVATPDSSVDVTELIFEYHQLEDSDVELAFQGGSSALSVEAGSLLSNYSFDTFILHIAESVLFGANGFEVDGTLQQISFVQVETLTHGSVASGEDSPLVGAWTFGDASQQGSGILVFLANGTYFHAEHAEEGDTSGMERGTYSWNQSTGAISFNTEVDTNGDIGVSDSSDISRFDVSGNTLTITFTDNSTEDFPRVISSESDLVGAWQFGNGGADDSGVIVFLENGYYFHAEDSNQNEPSEVDGMEKGTYTWDSSTGDVTYNIIVDTNSESGLSHSDSSLNFEVDEDSLIVREDQEVFTLYRVAPGVSTSSGAVTEWRILKSNEFEQLNDSQTSHYFWNFYSFVGTENYQDATSVSITNNDSGQSYNYERDTEGWSFLWSSTTKEEVDANFPNDANYTITVSGGNLGTLSQEVTFGSESYPNVAQFTDGSYSKLQGMSVEESVGLTFADPGNFSSENGRTILSIKDQYETSVIYEDSTEGPVTSKTIPANTLEIGTTYLAHLEYAIGEYISGDNGFGVEGSASFNTETFARFTTEGHPLTGAWLIGDPSTDGSGVIVFLPNGTYFHVEDAEEGDTDGIERGTYSWDPTTGAFSTIVELDTNGDIGLSDTSDIQNVFVVDDALEVTLTDSTVLSFPKIVRQTDSIVGPWQANNGVNDGSGVLVFLEDGTYFHAEDVWEEDGRVDGMEKGTYTWNSSTGAFTATVTIDTNETLGFSHMTGNINVELNTQARDLGIYITDDSAESTGLAYQIYNLVSLDTEDSDEGTPFFGDGGVELAVRKALGLGDLDILTIESMQGLSSLTIQNKQIVSLDGLEHATNLTRLNLSFNLISDLSPLADLTGLTYLNLSHNEIDDITALAGLTNLTFLDLSNNDLEDINTFTASIERPRTLEATGVLAPLVNITGLTTLKIANNYIQKLDTLSSLSSLEEIDISGNQVDDLTPLAAITTLMSVRIYENPIDLSEGSDQLAIITQIASDTGAEVVTETPTGSLLSLRIDQDPFTGEFYLRWDDTGILRKSTDMESWTDVEDAESPLLISEEEADLTFWRLVQPN